MFPLLAALLLAAPPSEPAALVVAAGRTLMPDGSLQAGIAVRIENGKIARIGPREQLADGARVVAFDQGVLSPGLIDTLSAVTISDGNAEPARRIAPDMRMAEIVDSTDVDLPQALSAGITALWVAPGSSNLMGGSTAVLRLGKAGAPSTLLADGPLFLTAGPTVLDATFGPTSTSGAMYDLAAALTAAREKREGPLADWLAGKRGAVLVADSAESLDIAQRALEEFSLKPAIALRRAADALPRLTTGSAPVLVGPFGNDSQPDELAVPAALVRAGREIAFRGGFASGSRDALRRSAALAVRYGLDAAAARAALTAHAAKLAGVEHQIGTLEAGAWADCVVFSADPLRADARAIAVFSGGERVWSEPRRAASDDKVYVEDKP